MATIPTTSKITTSADEENRTDYETDLSAKNTDDEIHVNTSNWSHADKKRLQHMTEFHQEYQHIFGDRASICKEEMQSAHLINSEVIIEYMTNTHGNKIKKLKPIFIKSEPDREYTQHIESDDDLPAVPEENITQKREVTVDSCSESISSNNDESSDDRTVTVDSNSSTDPSFQGRCRASGKLIQRELKPPYIR